MLQSMGSAVDEEQAEFVPYPTNAMDLLMMTMYSPLLSAITIRLRQEVLRKGIDVEKEYASRCPTCMINYEDKTEDGVCDECGGKTIEPDPSHRKVLLAFQEQVNKNGDSLERLISLAEDDVNIYDDLFVLAEKDYVVGPKNNILGKPKILGFSRLAPGKVWLIRDHALNKTGNDEVNKIKRGYYTCVLHRKDNLQSDNKRPCKVCGKPLVPCDCVGLNEKNEPYLGWIDDEVYHDSRYRPTQLYGVSPVLTLWTLAQTLINMDSMQNATYKHNRPPKGMLFVNTDNVESFNRVAEKESEQLKKNINHMPKYAVSSKSTGPPATFINITPSYVELQNVEQRAEIRRAAEAIYGVSNIMMGDTSTSGGLNNEGMQLTVTLNAVQSAQAMYHKGLFKWMADLLDVEGWVYKFPDPQEMDKAAIQERKQKNLEMILKLKDRGAEPTVIDHEDLEFAVNIDEIGQPPMPVSPFGPGASAPPKAGGNEGGGTGKPPTPEPEKAPEPQKPVETAKSFRHPEDCGHLPPLYENTYEGMMKFLGPAPLFDEEIGDLLKATNPTWHQYSNVTMENSTKIGQMIMERVLTDKSLARNELVKAIQAIDPKIDDSQAEAIARTELTTVVNKGREMLWKRNDPLGTENKYAIIGPRDYRCCDAHENIMDRQGMGLSLPELKALHRDVFAKAQARGEFKGLQIRDDFTLHPNQRHVLINRGPI